MRNSPSIESARRDELDRALRLLRRGEDPAHVLGELSRRLTNKLIHAPTKALRDARGDRHALASLLARANCDG